MIDMWLAAEKGSRERKMSVLIGANLIIRF